LSESLDRASGRHSQAEQNRIRLESWQVDFHTCLPAVITDYDDGTKRASVKCLPMRKHTETGDIEIPELLDLPVQQPFAGRLYLGLTPKVGDECVVLFSEREIESAKENAQPYELRYSRMHNLSDGVVVPLCFSIQGSRDVLGGVSLIECFQELLSVTRMIALEAAPSRAPEVQAIISKLEGVL